MKVSPVLTLICCIFFSSCSLFQGREITSYYRKVESVKEVSDLNEAKKVVELTNYYVKPDQIIAPKEEYKNSLMLQDRGQEKYLEILGEEFKGKPSEFIKHVAAPFKGTTVTTNESIIDKSQFPIKINLNIEDKKNDAIKANRISAIKVKFELINEDVDFIKFNNIQTKYEVLDFGKMTNTDSKNISLNAGANVVFGTTANTLNDAGGVINTRSGSNTPTVGGSFGASNSNTQEVLLTKRVLSQNAALTSKYGYVSLEGTPTNNLEGPLNIEFTMKSIPVKEYAVYKFSELFNKDSAIQQDKIKISTLYYQIPDIKEDVKIAMTYEFIYREVNKKHQTVSESDDHITYHTGTPTEQDTLVGVQKKDLKLNVYYLYDEKSGLYLEKQGEVISFQSVDDADSFRKWLLVSESMKVQNQPIGLGGVQEMTKKELPPHRDLSLIIVPVNLYEFNEREKKPINKIHADL